MIRLYGPANTHMRGGTITLNFYDPEGRLLDYRRIEELANEQGISLRTGCFCNPGAGEIAEGLTQEDMLAGLAESEDMTLPRFVQLIQHRMVTRALGPFASRWGWLPTLPMFTASCSLPPASATKPTSTSAKSPSTSNPAVSSATVARSVIGIRFFSNRWVLISFHALVD